MALITDPDLLNDQATDLGTSEVFINTSAKTIALRVYGNLASPDGVTIKAVYSFLKEEWTGDPFTKNLPAFPFPMVPITDAQFELVEGWNWADATTRQLLRRGGWIVRNTSGADTEIWANIQSLGAVGGTDQLYYTQTSGVDPTPSPTNFTFAGAVDEAVQVLSDPNGDDNYADGYDRRGYFKVYNRIQGKTYNAASLADLSNATMAEPVAYGFAVGVGSDPKITVSDNDIDTLAPYTGMSITSYAVAQSRTIAGVSRDFGVIINGNSGTAEQIYNWMQRQLRKATDIDADATGTIIGQVCDPPLDFVTATLKTLQITNPQAGGSGVYIDNIQAADVNRITFTDNLGIERAENFQAALTLEFNPNLVNDPNAEYTVYFTTLPGAGDDWGESGAVIVDDAAAVDMTGLVNAASIQHTFAYTTNNQGGRTPDTDADVTVVAIGHATGQYVKQTGTIEKNVTNKISLTAPLERNYSNP